MFQCMYHVFSAAKIFRSDGIKAMTPIPKCGLGGGGGHVGGDGFFLGVGRGGVMVFEV